MTWGSFGVVHILTLLAAVGINIGLFFLLRGKSEKLQITVLGILSFSGILAVVCNLVMWDSPLEYLPLHLCSLNALVLPFAVFCRSKVLNNLLLVWSLGAAAALIVNTAQAEYVLMSDVFCIYYFPHVLECGIPILMFALKLVKKDPRCILSTLGITAASYTVIHFINVWLNDYCAANNLLDWAGEVITVNYMYSLVPANPLLELFWSLIPVPYWYMYLIFPIVAIYLLAVYAPELLAARKKVDTEALVS